MKCMNLRKTLSVVVLIGAPVVAVRALAQQQSGYGPGGMMGDHGSGWMDGYGFGGIWVPVLFVIVVAALVAWIVAQKKK